MPSQQPPTAENVQALLSAHARAFFGALPPWTRIPCLWKLFLALDPQEQTDFLAPFELRFRKRLEKRYVLKRDLLMVVRQTGDEILELTDLKARLEQTVAERTEAAARAGAKLSRRQSKFVQRAEQIRQLRAEGHKDGAIARRLDMDLDNVRTVRRRYHIA
jgi:hypothetical protein